jgi:hypothetical protein
MILPVRAYDRWWPRKKGQLPAGISRANSLEENLEVAFSAGFSACLDGFKKGHTHKSLIAAERAACARVLRDLVERERNKVPDDRVALRDIEQEWLAAIEDRRGE